MFACGQKNSNTKPNNKISENNTNIKDTIISGQIESESADKCDFDKFLKDPNTPKIAKELYYNSYKLKDDEPLDLLEKLESSDFNIRQFYFRVITNSYKISDGAYSEGLGNIGKEYIENKTYEFVQYFDNENCFTDKDLETWADIVILELSIIREPEYDELIIKDYLNKIDLNCRSCSLNQKESLNKFSRILEAKWKDFLKNID